MKFDGDERKDAKRKDAALKAGMMTHFTELGKGCIIRTRHSKAQSDGVEKEAKIRKSHVQFGRLASTSKTLIY